MIKFTLYFLEDGANTPGTSCKGDISILTNDIGDAVGSTVSNKNKYNLLCNSWKPPSSYKYPSKTVGSRLRKFQPNWLKEYPWLSYSKQKDGAFCRFCVLFAGSQGGDLGQLVSEPLQDFAKGKSYLEKHSSRKYHLFAKEKAANYKLCQEDQSISIREMVNVRAETEKERIRNGLRSIVKAVIYLSRQGQSFRGHRNEVISAIDTNAYKGPEVDGLKTNSGNFLSLLDLLASSDDLLHEHIAKSPRNRLYVTKSSQNRIIELIAEQIAENVVAQVKKADLYSIMIDECGDRSNLEQLAVTVRYVLDGTVNEKFLTLMECQEGTTGAAISAMIFKALENHGLEKEKLIALTTDGAGNMTGRIKGAATLVKEQVPNLQHVHCLAHVLNLSIVSACKNSYIQSMFSTVQSTYAFFSQSPKRTEALRNTITNSPNRGDRVKLKLKEVCQTRWVERYNALETMHILLPDVISTLETILASREWNNETQNRASQLLESLSTYKFIVVLVTSTNILLTTRGLCKKLQGRAYDIVQAVTEIQDTISSLEQLRESCFYEDNSEIRIWFEEIEKICTDLSVQPTMPRITKRQTHRNSIPADTPQLFYIRNVVLPFIDELTSELRSRYDIKNKNLLLLFALVPSAIMRLNSPYDGNKLY